MQQSNDLNHDRFLERTRIDFHFSMTMGLFRQFCFVRAEIFMAFSVHKRPKAQFVIQLSDMIPPVFLC
jgi:hypothetical protein